MTTVEPHKLITHSGQANPQANNFDVPSIFRLREVRIPLRGISAVQLPYTIYWAMLLFALLLFVVVGLVLGSRILSPQPIYPLAPFEGIKPGYPESVLTGYACRTKATAPNYGEMQTCEITPDDPLIQSIQVSTYDGMIQGVFFSLNDLPYGYLKLRWGNPEFVQVHKQFFVAKWQSGLYARGPLTGDFSYTAPVYKLSFVQA
jgi:hypothetical protein